MNGPLPGVPSRPSLDNWLYEHTEGLIAIRRNLHAHPELSGEEHGATELVAERLRIAGMNPLILEVGTGLLCDLTPDGHQGGALALRADIDALAMDDEKDVPYRSQVPGVAHACGHDVHTAVVLGTALYFAHHRDELPGPLRFVFQPAEERMPGGALDVLRNSGLDGVEAMIGIHCMPRMDVGTVGMRAGPITSAADVAEITLSGPGGHTARPEETIDIITLAARVVSELPGRVGAALDDPSMVRVVFGAIRSGAAGNVIPSHCVLKASVRTPSTECWELLPKICDEALAEILVGSNAHYQLAYTTGVPPVVSDPRMVQIAGRAVTHEFGQAALVEAEQSWGGDDFAWYTRQVPCAFLRLGTHDPADPTPRLDLHAGHFDVDERVIAIGVRALVASVHEFFADAQRPRRHV